MDQVKRVEKQRNRNEGVEVVLNQKQEAEFRSSFWIHRKSIHCQAEQLRPIKKQRDNREIKEHNNDVE